jgi:hypothetical protein
MNTCRPFMLEGAPARNLLSTCKVSSGTPSSLAGLKAREGSTQMCARCG